MFAKPQDKKEKAEVVATVIEKYYIFNDTEVLIYPTLLKTTVKRYWMASDIRKSSASVNAARGISPFYLVQPKTSPSLSLSGK